MSETNLLLQRHAPCQPAQRVCGNARFEGGPLIPADPAPGPGLWGTWTGTLRWFMASVESCYTFAQDGCGIVVQAGRHQGVGFASGNSVSFIIADAGGHPITGTLTLLTNSTAHMVVGGLGVQFEGQLVRE